MKRIIAILLVSFFISTAASAQTYYSLRQRVSASACTGLTDGKPADFCLQQNTPALYVCNNGGGNCTTSTHWSLLTPFYLGSGSIVYTVGDYTLQIGLTGTGTITSATGLNIDANNDATNDIRIDSSGHVLFPGLGAATTGTNFVCLNTSGYLVKSTTACSGT